MICDESEYINETISEINEKVNELLQFVNHCEKWEDKIISNEEKILFLKNLEKIKNKINNISSF